MASRTDMRRYAGFGLTTALCLTILYVPLAVIAVYSFNDSRSITNWESWYGSSDVQGLTEFEFGGAPWEQRELYRRLSPSSYVEQVTAPTLIIHSENDYRTPIGDGEQWYMALKKREIPTELVRYPRSSHGLSRTGEPWLLVDRLERIRSWFTHWLIQ